MIGVGVVTSTLKSCDLEYFFVANAKKIVLFFLRNEKMLEMIEELPDMGTICMHGM